MAGGKLTGDRETAALEVWKATIDVQKHFNELGLRVRSIAVTVLGAFFAAAGYAIKEQRLALTGVILMGALVCWSAFYVMDRLWYHRLLRAAVAHGRLVEDALQPSLPFIGLTGTIDKASPIWGMRAGHRLSFFYGFIWGLLWLAAGTALRSPWIFYVVGAGVLILIVILEVRSLPNKSVGEAQRIKQA
jgi:hypothetical protein